jgi:Clp amino terminal domain, pathogenicity island component
MLIYDDSFVAAMTASQQEATRLGAPAYGSEHMLLGLLVAGDPASRAVGQRFPQLTPEAVRAAVEGAFDDLPHLRRLGIAPAASQSAQGSVPLTQGLAPRNRHTPEFQTALNSATAKWDQLRRTHQLPRQQKLGSSVLWLAVLEPSARSFRLLQALETEPEQVRPVVLSAMLPDGQEAPQWPEQAKPPRVLRLLQRIFSRATVAN